LRIKDIYMNKKILHVVSSDAVKERVFQLINSSKNEEIVVCPTSLDYGILPKNYTKKELTATALSLQKYSCSDSLYEFTHRDYSVYNKVIVWHGRNAEEILLLYWMADLTKDNLYEIDVADCKEVFEEFKRTSLYHFPVIFVEALEIEELECYDWLGEYLKKVGKEQHDQYKSNWEYWRNRNSFLRVCRGNNWAIDSVDEELIVKMMHDIMNSDYYHKLPDWVKYAVLLSIITYDLYVDFSHLFVCNRIADLVLRNNKEITENGLVDLFDIIQWKEAYQFENFGRFRRLQKEDKRLMAKINNKV